MKRFTLLAPLFLAACGAHFDPCVKPCPDDVPPHLCDCQPFEGGGGMNFAPAVTPDAPKPDVKPSEPPKPDVKPDPKPETPKPPSKPEAPKHEPKEDHDGKDC